MRAGPPARPALVVSVGRNAVWIAFDDEQRIRPASLRKQGDRFALVPGDRVAAQPLDDEWVVVESREDRAFALVRKTAGGRTKTMAANVDTVAIVAALERPPLHLPMVDELLAFAEIHGLRAVLALTKPDLAEPRRIADVCATYEALGYDIVVVNPKAGDGVDRMATALAARHALLIGQSGVGKSSLFRALGGDAVIGEVSKIGRGRQTTTSSRLLRIEGGFLIDSPGVGEFELHDTPHSEVAYGFVEIRALAGTCRFSDCTHRVEPDCAVRAAVERGEIARSRYESYAGIVARAQS